MHHSRTSRSEAYADSLVPRLHSPAFYRTVRGLGSGVWDPGTRLYADCVRNSVYVRLYDDVMALRSANGGARRCRVLERIWSPFKVSTDATTAVFEEPGWLGTDFQRLQN